ncbi:MAG: phenylalanine--tRNA ligase subunit alpha [Bdellovibrionales bacterium]|nr:phenylalanine--tRNA ligase subunit alpha [Bdellovibrionales bacterium]
MAQNDGATESTLHALQEEALASIRGCTTLEQLQEVEKCFLGKKGSISEILKGLKDLSVEERKSIGKLANEMKVALQESIVARRDEIEDALGASEKDRFDVTLPGTRPRTGGLHPVTRMRFELNDAFHSLGFEVFEGPEISSEQYAFDVLNFPADHPARESMDTYWLDGYESKRGAERVCLRPHLTGGSVRYMQTRKPPFRFVYPGRVYRNESTDAGHERAFYQYEALMVDKHVPFSAGKLMVNTILERVFGKQVPTRMRAGFFPFVEPGFEIDMQCLVCGGKGCSVCGHSGWVEVMPGGPPHPNVFRAGGINPEEWQGFYINIGLDRLVMMKYGLDDIRLLHSGDLRFLNQFA